eukprot:CAMPEP_0202442184 /NCGR_PEP_ID=MMETSP1360-20130828/1643_1 /ASSEMBLY_ACC=CAM_ASM_000848 /TAXON_ID=515479 /ORGANISM="Licmophora paradoxa, Strain CCMP2313" /LENGTH=153 /DNA_ID=CAMNT_0049057467 /DNA_START=67 /DNA_END=528 /DNA_ORIENTATION=-
MVHQNAPLITSDGTMAAVADSRSTLNHTNGTHQEQQEQQQQHQQQKQNNPQQKWLLSSNPNDDMNQFEVMEEQQPSSRWGGKLIKKVRNCFSSTAELNNSDQRIERPDNLEYDYVPRSEKDRSRFPYKFHEKTVRLTPNGLYYRNRYKEKVQL